MIPLMTSHPRWRNAVLVACLVASPVAAQDAPPPPPSCGNLAPAVAGAHKGVFFANDFSYLGNPCLSRAAGRDALTRATDNLKRLPLGSGVRLDLGGEYRLRTHNENQFASTRLAGGDNSFTLSRLRVYANLEIGKHIRVYAEGLDARSFAEDWQPRPIEVDEVDLLNGFAEVRVGGPTQKGFARVGRQELLLGAQRLISPLDWGNTRRSFDGVAGGYQAGALRIDVFGVFPRTVRPHETNTRDDSQRFSGLYLSRGRPGTVLTDVYLLNLRETRGSVFDYDVWTAGARSTGTLHTLTWEVEGGYQWGDHDQEGRQRAGFLSAVVGHGIPLPGRPKLEAGFDWAQGDDDSDDGTRQTFNQLFPLAHAYLGYMDLVARQNILAVSVRASAQPTRKLSLQATGFDFRLDSETDALYNAGGGAIRRDATGAAGNRVGRELDLMGKYLVTPRSDLVLGFSRFWGGRFVDATNPEGVSGDADFFYTQVSVRF